MRQAVVGHQNDRFFVTLKGASHRLRNRGIDTLRSIKAGIEQPDT
jgi:hypothetical protein